MWYNVEIIETLSRTERVNAGNSDAAFKIVTDRYNKEEVVLDAKDFVDVKFEVKEN